MEKPAGCALLTILMASTCALALGGLLVLIERAVSTSSIHTRPKCVQNLKQLALAMITYHEEMGSTWPVALTPAASVVGPATARRVTNRSFELLARRQQLPNSIFACRFPGSNVPQVPPEEAGSGLWWGADSYAYDWAAPTECASYRILLSDRSPASHAGRGVYAVSVDSSLRWLKQTGTAGAGQCTEGSDGRAVTAVVAGPDDDDNIFDDLGDDANGHDGVIPLRGPLNRTWVK